MPRLGDMAEIRARGPAVLRQAPLGHRRSRGLHRRPPAPTRMPTQRWRRPTLEHCSARGRKSTTDASRGERSRCWLTVGRGSLALARGGLLAPEFVSIEEHLGSNTSAYYATLQAVHGQIVSSSPSSRVSSRAPTERSTLPRPTCRHSRRAATTAPPRCWADQSARKGVHHTLCRKRAAGSRRPWSPRPSDFRARVATPRALARLSRASERRWSPEARCVV